MVDQKLWLDVISLAISEIQAEGVCQLIMLGSQSTAAVSLPCHCTLSCSTSCSSLCTFLAFEQVVSLQDVKAVCQEEALVCSILGKLDNTYDLARCSTVSRCWRSAAANVRPTSLTIPGGRFRGNLTRCDHMLHWLQQKHRQNFFGNLRSLSLSLKPHNNGGYTDDIHAALMAGAGLGILTLAGLWHLDSCEIVGPFDLNQVVLLLPASLQYLDVKMDLEVNYGDALFVLLSKFQRFPELRSLRLSVHGLAPDTELDQYFELDADAVLGRLKCLHLSPMRLHSVADVSVALPHLTHAVLTISASEGQSYLDLPSIEDLVLDMVDMGAQADIPHSLTVAADSILKHFSAIVCPAVRVLVCKPNIMYRVACKDGSFVVGNISDSLA